MKSLMLLLILISYASTGNTVVKDEGYFHPIGTQLYCKLITHDYTLKDCYVKDIFWLKKTSIEVIRATNIMKVYQ